MLWEACRNAVSLKSEVTENGENKRGAGNTCRFLWRRALNSPADFEPRGPPPAAAADWRHRVIFARHG